MKVAILGGGIIGCSVAYHLKKLDPDVEVTVFERDYLACQASGRAGGFLAYDWDRHDPDLDRLSKTSFNMHMDLALEFGEEVGYRPLNTYEVKMDFSQERENPSEVKNERLPWLNLSTYECTEPEVMGTFANTAQVNPGLLTKALMESAMDKGAEVVKKEIVEILFDVGNKFKGVKTSDGKVFEADTMVLAVGPWIANFKQWFPDISHLFKFKATRVHSIILETDMPPQSVFVHYTSETNRKYQLEIYPRPDNTVFICGYFDKEPLPENPSDVRASDECCKDLRRFASMSSDKLKNAELKVAQAAYGPMSEDFKPVFGKMPKYPGCYIAGGHGWWGVLHAPTTGLVIASEILGKKSPFDASPFRFERFENQM